MLKDQEEPMQYRQGSANSRDRASITFQARKSTPEQQSHKGSELMEDPADHCVASINKSGGAHRIRTSNQEHGNNQPVDRDYAEDKTMRSTGVGVKNGKAVTQYNTSQDAKSEQLDEHGKRKYEISVTTRDQRKYEHAQDDGSHQDVHCRKSEKAKHQWSTDNQSKAAPGRLAMYASSAI